MVKYIDKTRNSYCGMKGVVNSAAWGEAAATKRYKGGTKVHESHAKGLDGQDWLPQHGDHSTDKTYNDTPNNWLRGFGSEQGQGKPEYERSRGYRSPSHAGAGRDGGETGDQATGNYSNNPMRQGPAAIRGRK